VLDDNANPPHAAIRFRGEPLEPPFPLVLMLHKPDGYTCSADDPGATIYDLLPPRFALRNPQLSPVGRLDKDTTGLLLLTDDGALLHRLTSPRSHLPKTYRVQLTEALAGTEGEAFAAGTLLLDGERTPLAPATLMPFSAREARLTITEGRYHQVRRMFAAVGNHVTALHRESLGPLTLGELGEGAWRLLTLGERAALDDAVRAARARPGASA
jgi:16S rRNA pseudouridine516 synthase